MTELLLLAIVKIKTNLKLAYAVYGALPTNIIKYMSYVHLFCITSTHNMYIWFLLLYYKIIETGNNFKKVKRTFLFLFYRMQIFHIFSESTQTTN